MPLGIWAVVEVSQAAGQTAADTSSRQHQQSENSQHLAGVGGAAAEGTGHGAKTRPQRSCSPSPADRPPARDCLAAGVRSGLLCSAPHSAKMADSGGFRTLRTQAPVAQLTCGWGAHCPVPRYRSALLTKCPACIRGSLARSRRAPGTLLHSSCSPSGGWRTAPAHAPSRWGKATGRRRAAGSVCRRRQRRHCALACARQRRQPNVDLTRACYWSTLRDRTGPREDVSCGKF